MRPLLKLEGVTVKYEERVALEDVTFEVPRPSFLLIVGPNGAGKTTLLKTALGLVRPSAGRVEVLGLEVPRLSREVRKRVGYVPQRDRIDPSMPVLVKDVVLMGRVARVGVGRRLRREDFERAREALEAVGLLELWDEPFSHLSGGQQQRVLVARALAAEPDLLMLDEPLSGVDAISRDAILDALVETCKSGIGVVLVAHDLDAVADVADYVLLLDKRVMWFGRAAEAKSILGLAGTMAGRR